ncbi:NON-SPECIFIC LIPID-TRANSFER PROTEIN 13 [Salix viminalis]|uniref:NON-SPECIFIC LIPID-TRANSFER PROTEIN 13 n=1 Tax=Salix viminalis TaxID=40686 RepID=A0A9Q0SHV1_SALVM|nr:NON-SPECIFIC LIPID-TRANSFER PROTEIN 13 [Salix viminalis]
MALFKAESMVRVVGFLLLLVSGQAMVHQIRFDSCKIVSDKLSHCLDFLEGSHCKPSNQCCQSIYDLNAIARVVMGPRFICQCIENVTTVLPTRIRPDRIGRSYCQVQTRGILLPFLSTWTATGSQSRSTGLTTEMILIMKSTL